MKIKKGSYQNLGAEGRNHFYVTAEQQNLNIRNNKQKQVFSKSFWMDNGGPDNCEQKRFFIYLLFFNCFGNVDLGNEIDGYSSILIKTHLW